VGTNREAFERSGKWYGALEEVSKHQCWCIVLGLKYRADKIMETMEEIDADEGKRERCEW
jgi:hypothetical protein